MSKENAYADTLLDVPETAGRVCRPGGKVERVGVEPYVLRERGNYCEYQISQKVDQVGLTSTSFK